MATLRVPPHADDAERSVLGALLMSRDAMIEVAELLIAEMFYTDAHQSIYDAMQTLYENRDPIDVVTVGDLLKKKKVLTKVGGVSYLTELVNSVPTSAHIVGYAKIVKDRYVKRQMIEAAASLAEMAFDEGEETEKILDQAEQTVFALSQRNVKKGFMHVKDALAESFDRLDELHKSQGGIRGVPTGFKDLDNALAGMQDSNLLILAARPGIGKTTFATNIAQYLAVEEKIPIGYFALEMSNLEMVDRMLVGQANIDAWKMKTGNLKEDEFMRLSEAMGILADSPLFIDDTPGVSILEMRTKARRLQVEHGIKLIVVDYLQLATASGKFEGRVQEVQAISQGLKNLARELKIPVLALSQLSRAIEQRGTKVPQLSDLRESGCLTGETLIVRRDTGDRVMIKDLVGKTNVPILAMDKNMRVVPAMFSNVFLSGKKLVYEMKLKSGRKIRASANHPFFKVSGWTRLDELKVGDRLATARKIEVAEKDSVEISDARLILLAHLIGDGCYLKRQPLHYTNSEPELIEEVRRVAVAEFAVEPRVVPQQTWYHLYLPAKYKLARGRRNPIVQWIDEDLGIFNQHSREKRLPKAIFNLSTNKIALFLKHLWATDGCVHVNRKMTGPRVRIYYGSGSQTLAEQVSHLLLRLGIISKVTSTKKSGYEDMWNVVVQGKVEQLKFLELIGCIGKKGENCKRAIKILEGIKENPNNDVIPKDIWLDIEKTRIEAGLSSRDFHAKLKWAYSGTQRHKNGISRSRLTQICEVLKNEKLLNLRDSDLFWDEVVEITEMGEMEVFDATVPDHASFLANDIVVHNSIEQDADVVMFLYRESDEDLSDVKLSIAKHRNGPLRTIDLNFRGDRVRFFGVEKKREG